MSPEITRQLKDILTKKLNAEGEIGKVKPVGGGSINSCFSFHFAGRDYFLKINEAARYPKMLELEAKGLELLSGKGLVVPQAVAFREIGREQFLVLEHLGRVTENEEYFFHLGKGLAQLHSNTDKEFGLDYNNYMGSLPQANARQRSWNEFFICQRIEPLLKQAIDSNELPFSCGKNFKALFNKLDEIFPIEQPALLHGDLWSGNKMNTTKGPAIFDPAVYYGHREVDLAMTQLFGGFHEEFYNGYQHTHKLESGWEQRAEFFNLYPLLVHVILFGGSYVQDVLATIRKF